MKPLAAVLLLTLATGCAREAEPPPLPDLQGAEPQVAARIAEYADRVRKSGSAADWGRLGMVLDAHRFNNEAAQCYRRAVELEPASFEWSYHLAVVSDALDADAAAIDGLYSKAAGIRGDYAPLHVRWAQALGRRGNNAEAQRRLEQALDLAPDFAAAHRSLGQLRLLAGDAAGARNHLERAARLDPADGTTFAALAQARQRTGDTEGARQASARTRARLAQSEIPDALRAEVAELNTSSTAVSARARAAMAAGRHHEAIDLFVQADAWNPQSVSTQLGLGACYLRAGRPELAEERFRKAIEMTDDAEAHWRLGVLRLDRGEHDPALEHLRHAARNAHDSDPALLGQIATALARAGVPAESLPLFERARAAGGETAGLVNNWGVALLELGRREQALERFERALALDPNHADAAGNAARVRGR